MQGVNVAVLNNTAVWVNWERVSLPLEEVTGYTIYFNHIQSIKRQSGGTATFCSDASSGVIDGLSTGAWYQFEVAVNAITTHGTVLEGERSKDSIVVHVFEEHAQGMWVYILCIFTVQYHFSLSSL